MTSINVSAKDALVNEVRMEADRIQLRTKELDQIIVQSQAEVKRLQQKTIDVQTQLSRLEANFDTVPRNDIKVVYNNAIDTKTRLLSMQSQLEKVQQDHNQLEGFGKMLNHMLDMLQDVSSGDISSRAGEPSGAAGLNHQTIIRMVEAQESERQRLARQLHDGPAQSLTNFILQAEICQRLFDRNPDRASEELVNLKTAASTSFQKVRDFIFDLRPMMLDDLGLVPTVRRYVEAYADKTGIETRLNVVGEERRRMESHTEVMMFRGIQELLGYARDTSGSSKVDVVLDVTGNPIKSNVTFNGKNLDETEAAQQGSGNRAMGLAQLQERMGLVGGSMDLYGSDSEGNRVDINLPAGTV